MQERQNNRLLYFQELAFTSRKYFMPYVSRFKPVQPGWQVLEIGCGDGGNLLPFAQAGCRVTGVDMSEGRIGDARQFFADSQAEGTFIASDIFKLTSLERQFDLIICHDVLEHIADKRNFLSGLRRYVRPDGIVFMSFPAWQMPFGGHQQICRNKLLAHLPFIHLLPSGLYRALLKAGGETPARIDELLEIKSTRTPIETFERLAAQVGASIVHRELYFINPHYETKFGLRPRKLTRLVSGIPYVRNFFTTSCFYILRF